MAERWTIVAALGDKALVQIRHSDSVISIRGDLTREEMFHAITELANRVLVLQQTLAAR